MRRIPTRPSLPPHRRVIRSLTRSPTPPRRPSSSIPDTQATPPVPPEESATPPNHEMPTTSRQNTVTPETPAGQTPQPPPPSVQSPTPSTLSIHAASNEIEECHLLLDEALDQPTPTPPQTPITPAPTQPAVPSAPTAQPRPTHEEEERMNRLMDHCRRVCRDSAEGNGTHRIAESHTSYQALESGEGVNRVVETLHLPNGLFYTRFSYSVSKRK